MLLFANFDYQFLTCSRSMLPLYGNQSIDKCCKSTDWLLYDDNYGIQLINCFTDFYDHNVGLNQLNATVALKWKPVN